MRTLDSFHTCYSSIHDRYHRYLRLLIREIISLTHDGCGGWYSEVFYKQNIYAGHVSSSLCHYLKKWGSSNKNPQSNVQKEIKGQFSHIQIRFYFNFWLSVKFLSVLI